MPGTAPPPNAGVNFPPPFIYVAALLVAVALDRWRRLPIATSGGSVRMAGVVFFIVLYLLIFTAAFAAFRRARTTLIPNRPAAAFVTAGPYRFTRNPMYVSMTALYLGLALYINSWWAILVLPLVILVVDRAVIAREERYLQGAFPAEYDAYRARVRRWL